MAAKQSKQVVRYHHGNLRNALLKAARKLLEERGPSSLNLREIARRVGVSAPSAYHHFSNLDAIAVGLAEEGAGELAVCLADASGREKDRLIRIGEAYVAYARENPALYRLMFGEGFPAASPSGNCARNLRRKAYEIIQQRLAERLPKAQISIAATFLWSIVHGLSLLIVDSQIEKREDIEAMVHSVLLLAGRGLAGPVAKLR